VGETPPQRANLFQLPLLRGVRAGRAHARIQGQIMGRRKKRAAIFAPSSQQIIQAVPLNEGQFHPQSGGGGGGC